MLNLKNVVVHYGGVQALKGISLEVEEGAITCLIGANGAGKSTTLRAISGIVPLTAGEIWFQGSRIDGMDPEEIVEMRIGHVPEGKKLFLEMNIRDNLLTGAYLRRDKEFVEQDLQRVYSYFPVLAASATKPASKMSGGEQQMIAIGRGLMCAPKLLLLDEPSLGLSPILTREVGSIIKKIADEGVSILLIEQNANLAFQLAKKCYVLETGRIALEGSSKELQNDQHVKAAYLGISCTLAAPIPSKSTSLEKSKELPAAKPDEISVDLPQAVKETVLQAESRPSASHTMDPHASLPARRRTGRLDKLRTDPRPPEVPAKRGSNYGINLTAGSPRNGGGPSPTKTDAFTRLPRDKGPERLSKVVKKVFTPGKS
jgi:branched-chain amino acid transport system ATP-binding protein